MDCNKCEKLSITKEVRDKLIKLKENNENVVVPNYVCLNYGKVLSERLDKTIKPYTKCVYENSTDKEINDLIKYTKMDLIVKLLELGIITLPRWNSDKKVKVIDKFLKSVDDKDYESIKKLIMSNLLR